MNHDIQTERAASALADMSDAGDRTPVDTDASMTADTATAAGVAAEETATGTSETTGTPVETADASAAVPTDTAEIPLTAEEIERQRAEAQVLTAEEAAAEDEVRAHIEALPYRYRRKPLFDFAKRLTDILLSGLLLLLVWPVFLIIAIAIKCDDGGKVFYRHKRIGRHGKEIYIHKFRSMKKNADQLAGLLTPEQLHQYYTEFKIDNDPRITKVGNFLRKTSLDELPQIWDIFTGKLSVIGPRPLVETETYRYYGKRDALLSVKPGLTGYWQAYARNDVGYGDGRRQEMELYYVENRSVWTDIKIFFKTIGSVVKRKGAR